MSLLLPVMGAHVELRTDGDGHCRLTFNGNYGPPLGSSVTGVDRALLHTVAQVTADAFLGWVSCALQQASSPGPRVCLAQ